MLPPTPQGTTPTSDRQVGDCRTVTGVALDWRNGCLFPPAGTQHVSNLAGKAPWLSRKPWEGLQLYCRVRQRHISICIYIYFYIQVKMVKHRCNMNCVSPTYMQYVGINVRWIDFRTRPCSPVRNMPMTPENYPATLPYFFSEEDTKIG